MGRGKFSYVLPLYLFPLSELSYLCLHLIDDEILSEGNGGGRVERLLPGKVGYFNIKNLYYLEELISKGGREGERERERERGKEKCIERNMSGI